VSYFGSCSFKKSVHATTCAPVSWLVACLCLCELIPLSEAGNGNMTVSFSSRRHAFAQCDFHRHRWRGCRVLGCCVKMVLVHRHRDADAKCFSSVWHPRSCFNPCSGNHQQVFSVGLCHLFVESNHVVIWLGHQFQIARSTEMSDYKIRRNYKNLAPLFLVPIGGDLAKKTRPRCLQQPWRILGLG